MLKGRRVGSDEVYVERQASSQHSAAAEAARLTRQEQGAPTNGGFPEPPPGGVVRVVRAEHDACGATTRVRLPAYVPPVAVRRVVCQSCAEAYEAPSVEEVELLGSEPQPAPSKRRALLRAPVPGAGTPAPPDGRRRLPALPSLPSPPPLSSWLRDPRSKGWRYLSIPVAAVAVVAALAALQGSDQKDLPFAGDVPAATQPEPAAAREQPGAAKGGDGSASFVRESSFSLALPAGWQRTSPKGGATFAAASSEGDAEATLWVERDAELSFGEFEGRSLDQLEALAGSARVVDRVTAPTPEGTIVQLAADPPPGSPAYEVTLRAAGPYRYYLSTTVEPDASAAATDGADLIHGSFVPAGANPAGGEG